MSAVFIELSGEHGGILLAVDDITSVHTTAEGVHWVQTSQGKAWPIDESPTVVHTRIGVARCAAAEEQE